MTTKLTLTESQVPDILKEIEEAYFDIPFENSALQTEAFVIAAQITPERAFRAIGLRMSAKIRALNELKFGRQREDIDIGELEEKIQNLNTSHWDRKRAEIDIQQKLENRNYTDKLANDALAELSVLYKHFSALPKYTREEFEQGERQHFQARLTRQVQGVNGALESLSNMTDDLVAIEKFEQETLLALQAPSDPEQLRIWNEYNEARLAAQK